MTFETKRIEVPSGSTLTEIVDTRMAEMSADGWTLVAVVGSAATHYLYYQREWRDPMPELPPSIGGAKPGEIRRVPAKKRGKT